MKILIATDNRFWRRSLGSHQRIYLLLEYLHKQGHALEVLFIGAPTLEDSKLLQSIPFAMVRPTLPIRAVPDLPQSTSSKIRSSPIRPVLREVLQLFQRLPAEIGYFIQHRKIGMSLRVDLALQEPKLRDFFKPDAIEQLTALLEKWQPDLLVIEYLKLSYLAENIPVATRRNTRVILDTHDVISERRARFHAKGRAHDIDITPSEEAAKLKLYDAIVAIQSRDAAVFRTLVPNQKVIVAGHGQEVVLHSRPRNKHLRFLFVGSDMQPNQDAAVRLAFDIWPRIYSQLRDSPSLSIVGNACVALEGRVLPPGIELKGFVDSLEQTYRTHDIFLNPVTVGGGLKIKNVEALAHGLALITSPVGAEGMEDGSGIAFLVADEDQDFVDAAIKLNTSESLRSSLAEAALAYARQRLDAKETYRELDEYLLGVS